MHEKFQLAQSRRQFSRLMGIVEAQQKALEDDPRPFLDKAYREVGQVRALLSELKAAAYGSDEMTRYNPNAPVVYESVQSVMMRRLEKVKKLISDFESGPSGESYAVHRGEQQ